MRTTRSISTSRLSSASTRAAASSASSAPRDVIPASVDPTTGVASKDVAIHPDTGVSARLFLPDLSNSPRKKLPILVYYHGGGFCIQSPFSHTYHSYLNSLVARAHILAVSVDYRLAPEHPLPVAYEDSWAALEWVASHTAGGSEPWLAEHGDFRRVFLAGDSAGANIAHQMVLRGGGLGIEGLVLVQPYFCGAEPVGSETRDPRARAWIEGLWRAANPPETGGDLDNPRLNPLAAGAPDLAVLGCRRVMVCVAEKEVLRDRVRLYYEALVGSGWGGEAELVESEGEDHVFHLHSPDCENALALMESIVGFFNRE